MTGGWPNLFIVGAGKSGTSSLHRYLGQHPDAFMSEPKEPDFFTREWDRADDEADRDRRAEAYRELFADAGDAEVAGETSPSYLWYPPTAERIAATVPEARIVCILRDPVERAYSHFLFQARKSRELSSFREAIVADEELRRSLSVEDQLEAYFDGDLYLFVDMGRYGQQVERYLDAFGADRVRVLLLDDLRDRPRETLREVAGFLALDPSPIDAIDLDVHNPYRGPIHPAVKELLTHPGVERAARAVIPERVRAFVGDRLLLWERDKPEMGEQARTMLEGIYAPEIDRLEALLDRDLAPLRASWSG